MPGEVKSYTDTEKPVSRTGEKVKYGKYDLIKPFTMTELKVHFGNPKPFKHVSGGAGSRGQRQGGAALEEGVHAAGLPIDMHTCTATHAHMRGSLRHPAVEAGARPCQQL